MNANFRGDPRRPRSNPQKAPDRPQELRLAETKIQTAQAGTRRIQLFDQDNKARKTHGLVLEGSEWVRVDNRTDGSVEVKWDAPPENASAKLLFGWKGGATCAEINDWTIPACELLLGTAASR